MNLFGFSLLVNLIDGHMSVRRGRIICLCSHQARPDLARHGVHGVDGVVDAFITWAGCQQRLHIGGLFSRGSLEAVAIAILYGLTQLARKEDRQLYN